MNSVSEREDTTALHLAASSEQEQVTVTLSRIMNIHQTKIQQDQMNPKEEVLRPNKKEDDLNNNLRQIVTISIPPSSKPSSNQSNHSSCKPIINPGLTILAIISGFIFFYTAVIDPPPRREITPRFVGGDAAAAAGTSCWHFRSDSSVYFLFVLMNTLGFLLSWAIVVASAMSISSSRRAAPVRLILGVILGVYVFTVFSHLPNSLRPAFGLLFLATGVSASISSIARWLGEWEKKIAIALEGK